MTLLLLFAFGSLGSLMAIPVFLFLGALISIDGPAAPAAVLYAIPVVSGTLALLGPLAGLWIDKTSGNVFWLWFMAWLTAAPCILACLSIVLLILV